MADENLELNELDDESPLKNTDNDQAINLNDLPGIDNLPKSARDLEAVYDIPVQVSAVLGKSTMQVSELLKLGRGAVIELDRKVGEAIDIYVNNRLVARGEVVVVEDRLGVTMTEIIKTERTS
jgi:flagellar motor switch protein FliN/FliY